MEAYPLPSRHDEVYTSSIATPELVGREAEIAQIERAIKDVKHSYIIYITGTGGIGKTVLAQYILDHLRNDANALAANSLIDLYHANQRTPDGFQQAILEKLAPNGNGFEKYIAEYQQLQDDILRFRDKKTILIQQEKAQKTFFEDINQLAQAQRIVIAIDTAEKLFYENDPVEKELEVEREFFGFQNWLESEFLPKVDNIVIIIAGRPGTNDSFIRSLEATRKNIEVLHLKGLTEAAALAYYDAVANHAESRGRPEDVEVAKSIRTFFTEEYREVVFWGLCEANEQEPHVRPLLLSLALDYSISAGRVMDEFGQPLIKVKALSEENRRQIEQQLASKMGYWVRESHRPIIDEILRALAFTRKGAEPALIASITGYDLGIVEEALKKNEIRNLAFIKTRVGDNRYFLHDEMYDLLRCYAIQTAAGPYTLPGDVYEAIIFYYKNKISKYNELISSLYRETLEGDFSKAKELRGAIEQRNNALVEDLHYQLRYSLEKGFEAYFRYSEESMLGDENLARQLRAELLSLLADERRYAEKQSDRDRIQEIDQFMQQKVIPDGAVRWVKWLIHLRNQSGKALDVISKLRTSAASLLKDADELTKLDLDSYEGYCQTLCGEIQSANKVLNEALIVHIENLVSLGNEPIRLNSVLARACNNLGYLARVEGKFIRAERYYAKAIPLWRFLKMPAQQATTVNNHAYVLSLLGQHNVARRQAVDALQLRQDLGLIENIISSLNTVAEVEIYAGNYREAQVYASEALGLAEKNDFLRVKGLTYLTMAKLSRFRSEPEHSPSIGKRIEYINRAREYSREAYDVFSMQIPEIERKIDALLEIGLDQRELYRLSLETGTGDLVLFEEAEMACQEARKNAEDKFLLFDLDATLSQCWLYYYHLPRRNLLFKLLQVVETKINKYYPTYRISTDSYPRKDADTVISVFSQLARMHILRGVLTLETFDNYGKQIPSQDLQEAAREFTLAFEYDNLIARDFRDTIRASNLIYSRLKKYNSNELLEIYRGIQTAPGQILPKEKSFTDLLLWQLMEEHFGTYDVVQRLVKTPD